MLEQRGYTVEEDEYLVGVKMDLEYIIVIFSEVGKLCVNSIKEYMQIMTSLNIKHSIVVHNGVVTALARKIIQLSKELDIELFSLAELQNNITTHFLVPKHEKCTDKSIRKRFGAKLPILLSTDPIARFYHFVPGDIIEVTRANGHVTYRIVR
jgi:DNA-directed RNA polymerase subunit H (RpoH/RPB5)